MTKATIASKAVIPRILMGIKVASITTATNNSQAKAKTRGKASAEKAAAAIVAGITSMATSTRAETDITDDKLGKPDKPDKLAR